MRWLSPLLLLSLGLHGLGLFVPVPKKAEVPEEVEELTLDSIQVSILPAEPAPDIPAQTPPSEETPPFEELQVPFEALSEERPPQILVEEPPAEPVSEEALPSAATESPLAAEDPKADSDGPLSIDPDKQPKSDASIPQEYSSERTQLSADSFFATSARVDETLIPEFVRGDTYELDYLGNECFEETEPIKSVVGVVIEEQGNRPQIIEGDIMQRTGYGKTDAAVQAWLDDLKSGGEGEGPALNTENTFGESVYSWIFEQKNRVWFRDKQYESYYFGIVVNLVNNACQ